MARLSMAIQFPHDSSITDISQGLGMKFGISELHY
jgi:hypothetical protein